MALVRVIACVALCACGFRGQLGHDAVPPDAAIDTPVAPSCLGAACRRMTITIDHRQVTGGPHETFPLYVRIADPDLAAAVPTGFDIAFTAADGTTKLAHERESFAANELVAWVAVPTLSSTADTILHMYYGDPSAASDPQAPAAVWDADYQAVWHLEETSGGSGALLDSTARMNHATTEGGVTLGVEGMIGAAVQLGGADGRLRALQSATLDAAVSAGTLGMWVNFTTVPSDQFQRLLMSSNTFNNDSTGFEWAVQSAGLGGYYYYPSNAGGGSQNVVGLASPFTSGKWHAIAVTQDYATRRCEMFLDGMRLELATDNTMSAWMNLASPGDWYWGGGPGRNQFTGVMDEIRVSKRVRTAGWIATEFANQRAPSMFYAVGAPVVGP